MIREIWAGILGLDWPTIIAVLILYTVSAVVVQPRVMVWAGRRGFFAEVAEPIIPIAVAAMKIALEPALLKVMAKMDPDVIGKAMTDSVGAMMDEAQEAQEAAIEAAKEAAANGRHEITAEERSKSHETTRIRKENEDRIAALFKKGYWRMARSMMPGHLLKMAREDPDGFEGSLIEIGREMGVDLRLVLDEEVLLGFSDEDLMALTGQGGGSGTAPAASGSAGSAGNHG